MTQTPSTGDFILKWRGDSIAVTLTLDEPRKGRAALRTNIGRASVRRQEIIDETEKGLTPLARAWTDIPLPEVRPGVFSAEISLEEVGVFSGKACFFPEGSQVPEWPDGGNFHIKVESAETRRQNSIYCLFPRQFGSFREVARRLPVIMDEMGFRIIQTLPPFPVPTTYAVMGEYGCPFAATDFMSVDPAMAEFDPYATPLDQFKELIGAVHAKCGLLFIDLPANHTGWASTLQTHHPEWFHRAADGKFLSPGAWGVVWSDLVELDYSNPELRAYMAEVFLFWCRIGVDGFRCDAGYMIPAETWTYIVAKVREEYPDTVFLLEGLGGKLELTDRLLSESGLNWAYSEIFQTYDRRQFEWYLPSAIARAEKFGTLVHFAETHDNDRLAKGGETYARLRVQLAALLSWQGAWGIANGVEWYCTEKIDVHGKNDLSWGAERNMKSLIARLNRILDVNPSFSDTSHIQLVTRGGGNTLAAVRTRDGHFPVLVLANLDCEHSTEIEWDQSLFKAASGRDLLTDETIDLSGVVVLGPGEVRCLMDASVAASDVAMAFEGVRSGIDLALMDAERKAEDMARVHIVMPRDISRETVVPANEWVEVSASCFFRLRLIDPETGKTLRVYRSSHNRVLFRSPEYRGDGTRCRRLRLEVSRYVDGRAQRGAVSYFIPPPSDVVCLKQSMNGSEVRANGDWRTVLSNGAGASSQIRVAWGEIRSQYDAILSANTNPNVPSDRLTLWTRTRCWLQREGYMREVDAKCVTLFEANPSGRFARWWFTVPCGMGQSASFSFTVSLVPNRNIARLEIRRVAGGSNDVGDSVRLVFRPDLEWRSFHATTKAFEGLDSLFPACVRPEGNGVVFKPYRDSFTLGVSGGVYHHEPQWSYSVPHPEEAARGQDGSGDLFSPGWVSADLKVDDCAVISGAFNDEPSLLAESQTTNLQPATIPLGEALRKAINLYIVRRDDLKTVIAGYPWFLDWGRDTFIFMRGMIAAGLYDDSLKILRAFAAFEEDGTLPNIIYGNTAGNRDTTDAPLWFIRCVGELSEKLDANDARKGSVDSLRKTCESIVEHYLTGTPNGIHVDRESALVWSPSHFTWMDTNYPACTPRIGYPVEIQALWISALRQLGRTDLADQATASLDRLFRWQFGYRDCLSAPNGESAAMATPEDTIRPNQLFLVTLGIVRDTSILRACEELLVPGGVRSLNCLHPLYRGTYAGEEDSCRKPAYHNGTVWAWPFPQYAEGLVELGVCTKEEALSLLAGAVENLNAGCLCHMSEIADGDAPHAQKGCAAQAWSDSELLRVWLKLGGR